MANPSSSLAFRLKRLLGLKFLAEGVSRILGLCFFLMLSRYLGAQGYGQYSLALAWAVLVSHLCFDFGLNTFVTREMARDSERLGFLFPHVMRFRALVCGLILFGALLFQDPLILGAFTLVMGLAWIDTLCAFYHGLEALEYEVRLKMAQRIMSLGFAFGVLLLAPSVLGVLIAAAVATWLSILVWGRQGPLKEVSWTPWQWKAFKQDLIQAIPFWFTLVFFVLYTRIDVVMLGLLARPEAEIGAYQASIKILDLLNLFPQLAALAIFPLLQRLYLDALASFKELTSFVLLWAFQLALPLSILGVFAAPFLIWILGTQYTESIPAFSILILSLLFNFHNFFLFYLLAVLKKEKWGIASAALGLLCNALLNLALIPQWGHLGAASSTVLTEAVVWLMNLGVVLYVLRPPLKLELLVKTCCALALLGLTLWLGFQWGYTVLTLALGLGLYLLSLYLSRATGALAELRALMKAQL